MTQNNTPQQDDVLTYMQGRTKHLMVRARAGTGKTYLLNAVAKQFSPRTRAIALAFNTENAKELRQRLPRTTDCKTFHGLGYAALKRVWGQGLQPDKTRQQQIIQRIVPMNAPNRLSVLGQVGRAVSLAMNALAQTEDEVVALMMDFDIPFEPGIEPRQFVNWVLDTMVASLVKTTTPSFDDMIYVPAAQGWITGMYEELLVDEGQDTNNAQMALVRNGCADSGRISVYGDDRQALYRFRGAGEGQFDLIKFDLQADERPLTWTFRCPERVVRLAQTIVPDYVAAAGAPEGTVYWRSERAMVRDARPGDAVISRTNYGCMRAYLAFLRRGIRAQIVGKSFADDLLRLVDRSRATLVPALLAWLESYVPMEIERLRDAKREERAEALLDASEALREICANTANIEQVAELRRTIEQLTAPAPREDVIQIMTVHKAKGMEWSRVWVIESTFNVRNVEGENCYYVAVTRSKQSLFLVSMPQSNGRTPGSVARELLPDEVIREWEADDPQRANER